MKRTTRKILAIVLVVFLVGAPGCAGWGTDGPADDDGANETGANSTWTSESTRLLRSTT